MEYFSYECALPARAFSLNGAITAFIIENSPLHLANDNTTGTMLARSSAKIDMTGWEGRSIVNWAKKKTVLEKEKTPSLEILGFESIKRSRVGDLILAVVK